MSELEPFESLGVESPPCPNCEGQWLVSESTGAMVPLRCRRNACPVCVLVNARRRAAAIAYAEPERAVLLTDVGSCWGEIRPRMKDLRYGVARETRKPFEWVWHVEPNPSGDGRHHVHAWTRGAYVDQRLLSRLADGAGMGSLVWINRVRSAAGASQYGLKGLGYGLKEVQRGQGAAYLSANGRRLTHQSRGFWQSADGETLGVRAAEQAAAAADQNRDQGPWSLVTL